MVITPGGREAAAGWRGHEKRSVDRAASDRRHADKIFTALSIFKAADQIIALRLIRKDEMGRPTDTVGLQSKPIFGDDELARVKPVVKGNLKLPIPK
jgi:hypothetical protein